MKSNNESNDSVVSGGESGHPRFFGNDEPNDDGTGEPEPPIEQQPKFTEQDERQEFAQLTSDELLKIQRDLLGVEEIARRLCDVDFVKDGDDPVGKHNKSRKRPIKSSTASPSSLWDLFDAQDDALAQKKLTQEELSLLKSLDEELLKLPVEDTDIYYEALIKCPDEISAERRLAFLDYEDGNPARAAKRLANYWDFRHEVFGHARCFLPMTLAGAMQDEVLPMAQRAVYQLLPATDASGRAILYFAYQKRDWEQYSLKQEFMAIIYQMELLMQIDDMRKKGFIFLIDGRNSSRKHYSMAFSTYIRRFDDAFPITIRSSHICYPMSVLHYLLLPVIKTFLPKRIRVRIKTHYGSTEEVVNSLADYNLPEECVPKKVGGKLVIEPAQFVVGRLEKEMKSTTKTRGCPANDQEDGNSESKNDFDIPLEPSVVFSNESDDDKATATDSNQRKKSARKQNKKKRPYNAKNPGGDLRMSKALKAKIDNPDMSLYEALLVGGFSFAPGQGSKDIDIKDADGISLKQVSLSIII